MKLVVGLSMLAGAVIAVLVMGVASMLGASAPIEQNPGDPVFTPASEDVTLDGGHSPIDCLEQPHACEPEFVLLPTYRAHEPGELIA